jgi:hypothetical protein
MPIILNQELYDRIKREADKVYDKPSAYKSMYIQRQYKLKGGEYADDGKEKNLDRWKKENWTDIGGLEYPVYRPTKRINKNTALTPDEIDPQNLLEQILLKQQYREKKNLPPFIGKGLYEIKPYSYEQAKKLGVKIQSSNNKYKKIDIYDYNNQYILSIGDTRYKDYPTYIIKNGIDYANERRRLYRIRHNKDLDKLGTAGYYASKILW